MVLVESSAERLLGVCGGVEFFGIGVRIIEIVVVKVLLLAANLPCGPCQCANEQGTADTTDNTTDDLLGRVAQTTIRTS